MFRHIFRRLKPLQQGATRLSRHSYQQHPTAAFQENLTNDAIFEQSMPSSSRQNFARYRVQQKLDAVLGKNFPDTPLFRYIYEQFIDNTIESSDYDRLVTPFIQYLEDRTEPVIPRIYEIAIASLRANVNIRREQRVEELMRIYKLIRTKELVDISNAQSLFSAMLVAITRNDMDTEVVENMLKFMNEKKCLPDEQFIINLLGYYCYRGDLVKSKLVLETMRDMKLQTTQICIDHLIYAYSYNGVEPGQNNADSEHLKELIEQGIPTYLYHRRLAAFAAAGEFDKLMKLFNEYVGKQDLLVQSYPIITDVITNVLERNKFSQQQIDQIIINCGKCIEGYNNYSRKNKLVQLLKYMPLYGQIDNGIKLCEMIVTKQIPINRKMMKNYLQLPSTSDYDQTMNSALLLCKDMSMSAIFYANFDRNELFEKLEKSKLLEEKQYRSFFYSELYRAMLEDKFITLDNYRILLDLSEKCIKNFDTGIDDFFNRDLYTPLLQKMPYVAQQTDNMQPIYELIDFLNHYGQLKCITNMGTHYTKFNQEAKRYVNWLSFEEMLTKGVRTHPTLPDKEIYAAIFDFMACFKQPFISHLSEVVDKAKTLNSLVANRNDLEEKLNITLLPNFLAIMRFYPNYIKALENANLSPDDLDIFIKWYVHLLSSTSYFVAILLFQTPQLLAKWKDTEHALQVMDLVVKYALKKYEDAFYLSESFGSVGKNLEAFYNNCGVTLPDDHPVRKIKIRPRVNKHEGQMNKQEIDASGVRVAHPLQMNRRRSINQKLNKELMEKTLNLYYRLKSMRRMKLKPTNEFLDELKSNINDWLNTQQAPFEAMNLLIQIAAELKDADINFKIFEHIRDWAGTDLPRNTAWRDLMMMLLESNKISKKQLHEVGRFFCLNQEHIMKSKNETAEKTPVEKINYSPLLAIFLCCGKLDELENEFLPTMQNGQSTFHITDPMFETLIMAMRNSSASKEDQTRVFIDFCKKKLLPWSDGERALATVFILPELESGNFDQACSMYSTLLETGFNGSSSFYIYRYALSFNSPTLSDSQLADWRRNLMKSVYDRTTVQFGAAKTNPLPLALALIDCGMTEKFENLLERTNFDLLKKNAYNIFVCFNRRDNADLTSTEDLYAHPLFAEIWSSEVYAIVLVENLLNFYDAQGNDEAYERFSKKLNDGKSFQRYIAERHRNEKKNKRKIISDAH